MRIKKKTERRERRLPLEDIRQINSAFLDEMERVKTRLCNVKDAEIIKAFHEVLLSAYNSAIDLRTLEREVDYDVKYAEIKERKRNLKPWRRCWLWRLLFQPVTNRAQDIIEKRAELEADIEHTAAEKALEDERKQLTPESDKKPCKRESERKTRDELEEAIRQADSAEINEAIAEPQAEARESAEPAPGVVPTQARRPRPPASCRKPRTGQ